MAAKFKPENADQQGSFHQSGLVVLMTVDRESRDEMAYHTRQLLTGKIGITEYSSAARPIVDRSKDRAIRAIYYVIRMHADQSIVPISLIRLVRTKLPISLHRSCEPLLAFLESDIEYRWPELGGTKLCVAVDSLTLFLCASIVWYSVSNFADAPLLALAGLVAALFLPKIAGAMLGRIDKGCEARCRVLGLDLDTWPFHSQLEIKSNMWTQDEIGSIAPDSDSTG